MMIKYCHELTLEEYKVIIKNGITYGKFAEDYPQPVWCSYPDATEGMMGCWSLLDFDDGKSLVTGRNYCKNCDCYIKKKVVSPPSASGEKE
jgi:hypothetical protein